MIDENKLILHLNDWMLLESCSCQLRNPADTILECIKAVEAQPKIGEWIPCSERMPDVETEVLIVAKRKYRGGDVRYITTTAMYEDGTVSENDSCWYWHDIEGEWDEENDCYTIPKGWWEDRHYNPDEVYNNIVDDEVVAWMPMPPKYEEIVDGVQ